MPEIISSIRQAGKIARQEELRCPSEFDDTFAKKFEVLFCGRVAVAHRKAPPALIDECIEGFSHVSGGFSSDQSRSALQPPGDGERGPRPMRKSFSQPGLRSLAFRKEFQDAGLRSSSFFSSFEESDIENHLISGHNIVQPTDIEENRTMLFTVKYYQASCTSPIWPLCSKENLLSRTKIICELLLDLCVNPYIFILNNSFVRIESLFSPY